MSGVYNKSMAPLVSDVNNKVAAGARPTAR